jgi:hypothetical protein
MGDLRVVDVEVFEEQIPSDQRSQALPVNQPAQDLSTSM